MGKYTCAHASTAKDTHPFVHQVPKWTQLTEIALLEYANKHSLSATQVPPGGISHALPTSFQDKSPNNVLVTASFGHIIPNSFLGHFDPSKRLNVHPSLLPRYRGAAPIQWTIANGDTSTGVSVQRLVEKGKGIDGGEIVGSVDGIVRQLYWRS
jgi:methionyl-tRNA formyltransferase